MIPRSLASFTLTALLLSGLPALLLAEYLSLPAVAQTTPDPKTEADRLFNRGVSQYQRRQLNQALESWQRALQLYRQLEDRQGEAKSLINLGIVYHNLGNFHKAIEFHQQHLTIARKIGDRKGEATALGNLGIAYDSLGEYDKAIEFYQKIPSIFRELGDRQREAKFLGKLGVAYSSLGNSRKAIEFYQQTLTLTREIGNRQWEGASLGGLGSAYDALGDYHKAIEFYQQWLTLAREIGNSQGEAASLVGLGSAYDALGDHRKAIEFYQQQLTLAREIGNPQGEAASLAGLGSVYDSLGDYRKAIEFYQQQLTLAREIGNPQGEALSLNALGFSYLNLSDYRKAIEFYQQALTLTQEMGNQREEGISLSNLGLAYRTLGNYRKAIDFHQQALAINRESGNQRGEAFSLRGLGNDYSLLGNYRKAIDFHQQALAINREIGDRQGEANALGNLGNTYFSLRDIRKAIEFYQKALTLAREVGDRQGEANSLGNLGNTYFVLDEPRKAMEFYQQSLAINREISHQQGEAVSLNSLGNTYFLLGDRREAIDLYQQSLAINREIGDRQGEARSLHNLGVAFLHNNQLLHASHNLHQSIQIVETLLQSIGSNSADKISFLEQETQPYQALQWVLILQDQTQQALNVAERGRSRALVEQMARALHAAAVTPPALKDIQRLAAEQNATLVEYSILPNYDILLVWVIHPSGRMDFKAVDLEAADGSFAELVTHSRRRNEKLRGTQAETSPLRSVVRSSREAIQAESSTSVPINDPLQQLHQILIYPIADLLPAADSHIIFIPHEELFLVPFAALKDEQGQYLIEKYAISTAPSLTALTLAQQHRQRVQGKTERALVVGNPALPKQLPEGVKSLEPLPDAEAEARLIAARFNTEPLLGAAATETVVVKQLHQARIIHLATHGLALDPPNWFDLSGRIVLAPSETDDGWLTATELVELTRDNPLNAEMVVLSACDTGLGRVTGDGILSLARALIVSGVPSIVVSLWKVPDDSTQFLMERFYEELETSDNRAQALRQAMLQTMEVHEGPADWAAFTLVGTAQ